MAKTWIELSYSKDALVSENSFPVPYSNISCIYRKGNERALIMRLHLLQAIVLFHQNRRSESQNMLVLAESELNQLKISDESVTMLVDMGK